MKFPLKALLLFFGPLILISGATLPVPCDLPACRIIDNLYTDYGEMVWQNPHNPPESIAMSKTDPVRAGQSVRVNDNLQIISFDPLSAITEDDREIPLREILDDQNPEELLYPIRLFHEHMPVPNRNALRNQYFEFQFQVENNSFQDQVLHYSFFYQNKSYKYAENNLFTLFKSGENFYGDFDRTDHEMRTLLVPARGKKTVKGKYRIIGDPRGEPIYSGYGWERPVRVGSYEFMLLASSNPSEIPPYLKNISEPYEQNVKKFFSGNLYLSPFILNCSEIQNEMKATAAILSPKTLKLKMIHDLTARIGKQGESDPEKAFGSLFRESPFRRTAIEVAPYTADLESFSHVDYSIRKARLSGNSGNTVNVLVDYSDGVSGTAKADSVIFRGKARAAVRIANRASIPEENKYFRDHAGVRSRDITYGKMRALIRFPTMMNKHNVWKGINNTFWCSQSVGSNERNWGSVINRPDEENQFRCEFDIEFFPATIAREAPSNSLRPGMSRRAIQNMVKKDTTNLIRALFSDFDYNSYLPAIQNKTFFANYPRYEYVKPGQSRKITYSENGKTYFFTAHREANGDSVSLTHERMVYDDQMFGDPEKPYIYEMEWKPTELIMRWGQDENNLEVVAYWNSEFAVIPNNLMTPIIAQHSIITYPGDWHSHYFLPFPNKDIVGHVLEFSIE